MPGIAADAILASARYGRQQLPERKTRCATL